MFSRGLPERGRGSHRFSALVSAQSLSSVIPGVFGLGPEFFGQSCTGCRLRAKVDLVRARERVQCRKFPFEPLHPSSDIRGVWKTEEDDCPVGGLSEEQGVVGGKSSPRVRVSTREEVMDQNIGGDPARMG